MTPWSEQQQRLLQAMGYTLYARVSPALPAVAAQMPPNAAMAAGPLLRALQSAAMRRDISAWVADPAALRGDARAKRALWPTLRSLRRASGSAGTQTDQDS